MGGTPLQTSSLLFISTERFPNFITIIYLVAGGSCWDVSCGAHEANEKPVKGYLTRTKIHSQSFAFGAASSLYMKIWRCVVQRQRENKENKKTTSVLHLCHSSSPSYDVKRLITVKLLLKVHYPFLLLCLDSSSQPPRSALPASLSSLCASGNPGRDDRGWCCSEGLTVLLKLGFRMLTLSMN